MQPYTFYLYLSPKDMLRVLWFRFKYQAKKLLGLHPKDTQVFRFKDYGKMGVSVTVDGDLEFEVQDEIDTSECSCEPIRDESRD